jgi:hypothetical protein
MTIRLLATIAMAVSAVMLAAPASAQTRSCFYNGVEYQHGDRVGGFVCQDGQWVAG